MIVYKLTNRIKDKVYICVTNRNLNDAVSIKISKARSKPRKMKLKDAYMGKSPFEKAILRYGSHNFTFQILQSNVSEKEAYQYKKAYIKEYNAMDPDYGYNCTTGGKESWKNASHVKERCRIAQTGKTMPESFIKIMKERIGELHPCFGIKHTKEAKENMRQGQLNSDYVPSKETKNKTSKTMKMRWQEPEVIAKMAKRERGEVTAATRKKLSKANSGKNNANYGRIGALNPNYGIPIPQWQKDIISKKNKEHARKRKEKLLKEYSQRTEKKCCKCEETKTLDMFYKSSQSLDGLVSRCKPCSRKYGKEKYYRLYSPNKIRNRYGELINAR